MHQPTLFDSDHAELAKQSGMDQAAENRKELLNKARAIGIFYARVYGKVTADDVMRELKEEGIQPSELGNAAGSIFKSKYFECIGRVNSTRVTNHAREIKVWRLR